MSELSKLKGVGPKTEERLVKMGIESYRDLLEALPTDYVDFSAPSMLSGTDEGTYVYLELDILKVSKPFRKGRLSLFSVSALTQDGDKIKLSFYNSPFAYGSFREGYPMRVYGKLSKKRGYELINPAYESAYERKWKGIKPIYRTRGILPQATYASLVEQALRLSEPMSVIGGKISLKEGYRMAHAPRNVEEIKLGRERVLYEKLATRIAAFRLVRSNGVRTVFYRPLSFGEGIAALPFTLTPSQANGVKQIVKILCSDQPLNAMLVGDVGSGKTAVALLAAYFCIKNGHQAAIMAPTGILAAQHAATARAWFHALGVEPLLVTGAMSAKERAAARGAIASGEAKLIVGTHAVFSKGVEYADLGLAVIDEQHRFGVAQRTALLQKGKSVDTLTLTATPIPRSLRLTAFGDMDVIEIAPRTERGNVLTALVGKEKKKKMFDYIAEECRSGAQAYFICPRVADEEGTEEDNASAVYRSLARLYPDVAFGLIHGQMKEGEKDRVLNEFREGRISALVATTVVEVGIDVPNANLMVILGAEKFGLASLHQLRGRIGRKGQKSWCFLYTEEKEENMRLSALVNEREGMKIAERDYEIRGGGDWLGLTQSGRGDFVSLAMIETAKRYADTVDMEKHAATLLAYAERLNLERVSLT